MTRFGRDHLRAAVLIRKGTSPMTGWVILVDQPKDFPNAETPHKVITTSEYLARPRLFDMGRPKLVNLSRSYAYQSKGYYASLLAEARGHRVVPTVETMLELREAKLYEHALPDLEDELNRCARRADFQPEGEVKFLVCFGISSRAAFRVVRPAPVRLVPLPGAGGHGRARRMAVDRPHPAAQPDAPRPTARRPSSAWRCTSTPSGNGAIPRRARSPNTTSPCCTTRTRRCRRRRWPRSSTSRASPRSFRSTSSRSRGASSRSSPSTTACSSARPPRSTTTPTALRGAPGRRACRSSTIRSR